MVEIKDVISVGISDPKTVEPDLLLLFSPHKLGKTSILSALTWYTEQNEPIAFMLDLEEGSKYVRRAGFSINRRQSKDNKIKDFIKIIKILEDYRNKNGKNKYKIGIVDNITILDEWMEYYATRIYMKSNIGKKWNRDSNNEPIHDETNPNFRSIIEVVSKQGSIGYYKMREHFKSFLQRIYGLFDKVILVGHVRDKLEDKSNEITNVSQLEIDLTGKLRGIIPRSVDAVGKLIAKGDERLLSFLVRSDTEGVGTRCNYLAGKVLPISLAKRDDPEDKQQITDIEFYWENIFPSLCEYKYNK